MVCVCVAGAVVRVWVCGWCIWVVAVVLTAVCGWQDGLHNEPMRDEVYLFLIKQCTGNQEDALNQARPGWVSHVGRAIELMAFCALHATSCCV